MKKRFLLCLLLVSSLAYAQENRVSIGLHFSQVGKFEPQVRFQWGQVLVGAGITLNKRYRPESIDSTALFSAAYQNEHFVDHSYYLTLGMPFQKRFTLEVLAGVTNRQRILEIPNTKFLKDQSFAVEMGLILGSKLNNTLSINLGYSLANGLRGGILFHL